DIGARRNPDSAESALWIRVVFAGHVRAASREGENGDARAENAQRREPGYPRDPRIHGFLPAPGAPLRRTLGRDSAPSGGSGPGSASLLREICGKSPAPG